MFSTTEWGGGAGEGVVGVRIIEKNYFKVCALTPHSANVSQCLKSIEKIKIEFILSSSLQEPVWKFLVIIPALVSFL